MLTKTQSVHFLFQATVHKNSSKRQKGHSRYNRLWPGVMRRASLKVELCQGPGMRASAVTHLETQT